MNILSIDTSTEYLTLAIVQQNELTAELTLHSKNNHSSRLMPAIVDMMEKVNLLPEQLTEIVVGQGPGSYTGTRIGITTAKTLAWSLGIPIHTVSSLKATAISGVQFNGLICSFFDARRQSVFTSLYRSENSQLTELKDEINVSMAKWLDMIASYEERILFVSPHVEQFKDLIDEKLGQQAIFLDPFISRLKAANLIMLRKSNADTSVHTIAPNYLRITEAEANLLKLQKGDNSSG